MDASSSWASVAQRALDAMAAPLTVPAVPALIVVSVDDVDDQAQSNKNVNDALLLKSLTETVDHGHGVSHGPINSLPPSAPAPAPSTAGGASRTFRWWKSFTRQPDVAVVAIQPRHHHHHHHHHQQQQQSNNANVNNKKKRKKSSEARVVNHQNNYVSVTVSENDPAHLVHPDGRVSPSSRPPAIVSRHNKNGCCPSSTPRRRGRTFCWWFFLFLLLVTVACLAFVAVSLVSLLRHGQGKNQ